MGRRAPVDWLMPRPRVLPPCHSFLRWQSWASASSSLETGREGIALAIAAVSIRMAWAWERRSKMLRRSQPFAGYVESTRRVV